MGVILGGSFPRWEFSGWELSSGNNPGGSFTGGSFPYSAWRHEGGHSAWGEGKSISPIFFEN